MSTASFNRQIKVTEKGARELSRILFNDSALKKSFTNCKKATKKEVHELLGVKK